MNPTVDNPEVDFELSEKPRTSTSLLSYPIAKIFLDSAPLSVDRHVLGQLPFDRFYERYSRGDWRSISLLNRDGDTFNGQLYEFEGPGRWTAYADRVPYIKRVVQTHFSQSDLKSVRVFCAVNGGMIVPHRDYLEFENGFVRLHLPIQTTHKSVSTEGSEAFHMEVGEVWFLNARRTHAAVNYAHLPRYHLVLDFSHEATVDRLILSGHHHDQVVRMCMRQSRPKNFLSILRAFGRSMISPSSVLRTFHLLCDYHFHFISDAGDPFDWLDVAAAASGNADRVEVARAIRSQFLGDDSLVNNRGRGTN